MTSSLDVTECSGKTSALFRLYVAGESPNSILALRNLKALCQSHYGDNHQIDVVDVLLSPERAWAAGVIVTPMVERLSPEPVIQIIGNLNNTKQVLSSLGLSFEADG